MQKRNPERTLCRLSTVMFGDESKISKWILPSEGDIELASCTLKCFLVFTASAVHY